MARTTIEEIKKNRLAAMTADERVTFDETYNAQRFTPHDDEHSSVQDHRAASEFGSMAEMGITRRVVVFDASDLAAESTFWAGMLDGRALADDDFHSVFDADDRWVIGVQLAPNHVPPDWPDGNPQQVHLDLHVDDPATAHVKAIALGARLMKAADLTTPEGHQVYADPAGHPFCIGWGHPDEAAVRNFLRKTPKS